jgi:hypothetical protein
VTSPDGGRLHADLDEMASAGSRWNVMTADLHPGPAPSPGDLSNPTSQATAVIHGTVQLSSAQLAALLAEHADKTTGAAAAMGAQDGASASQLKDMMGMLTSGGKDLMGIATNLGQTATQALTQVGTAVTQAGTTGMNAVITAVTTGAKGAAPGGGVAAGLTSPDNLNSLHHDATTRQEGDDDDRSTDTHSPARVQH